MENFGDGLVVVAVEGELDGADLIFGEVRHADGDGGELGIGAEGGGVGFLVGEDGSADG